MERASKRRRIEPGELHALLQAEFTRLAGAQCVGCRLPLPTYFAGAREGANWRLPQIGECASLCHTVVDEVVERFAARYELASPPAGQVSASSPPRNSSR